MFKKRQNNLSSLGILGLFLFFGVWWFYIYLFNIRVPDNRVVMWGSLYGLVALYGGIWGMNISRKWGGFHSVLGRSILFFSLGLFFQEVGQLTYTYFIAIQHIQVPYPSTGDFFFYGTIPLYILAVIFLAQAAGVHISLRSIKSKLQAILIPTGVLVIAYLLFLHGYKFDWSNPLKVFLDLAVPTGQAIYISCALLTFTLSRGILGGVMKSKVLFLLVALLAQFIADWTFLYQASRGTWYAGGVNDYMYLSAYFLMAVGLIQFKAILDKTRQNVAEQAA
jgi:hypothetical protein